MIRQFYLVNDEGTTFFFDERNNTLVSSISDLGFQNDMAYLKYENEYNLVKKENSQTTIQFQLVFLKGYKGYNNFLAFYKKSSEIIRLFYKYDSNPKFCYVAVKSLTKTELESGVLICKLTLDKLSLWLLKDSVTINVNEDTNRKVFPFSYPFTYSSTFNGTIYITNSGETKAPLIITMFGAVNNPKVEILKDGKVISTLKLLIESADCEIEVSSDYKNQYMTIKENDEIRNIYPDQDFTCDNFLFLDPGTFQIKFSPGVSSNSFCRVTKIEGYSGH